MARKVSTREGVLLGVLAVAALWVLFGRDGGFGGGAGEIEDEFQAIGTAPEVRMDQLDLIADAFDPAGRSLFKYYVPPPKAPVRRPPPPQAERPKPPPPRARPAVDRKPPPPPVAKPPRIEFTFVGLMGPKENKIAVFENDEDGMMLARTGEVVDQEFRLLSVEYDTVVFGYTDDRFKDQTTELVASGK